MLNSPEERVLNGLIAATADRQQILANNLTNVSTPNYTRRDLDFGTVLRDLQSPVARTNSIDSTIKKAVYDDNGTKPSFEKEMAEMYENHLKYLLLVKINGHVYKHMEEATQAGRAV